jgi:hypothetical protein
MHGKRVRPGVYLRPGLKVSHANIRHSAGDLDYAKLPLRCLATLDVPISWEGRALPSSLAV